MKPSDFLVVAGLLFVATAVGCTVEPSDSAESESASLSLPFTKANVFMKSDLYLPAMGDSYSDAQATLNKTPFVGWRLVRGAADPASFWFSANRPPDTSASAIAVDPELWLLDENFQLLAHNDDATSSTRYSRIDASWGSHPFLYVVARNKTPARFSFQQSASSFLVAFHGKTGPVDTGVYDLLRDASGQPATVSATKPVVYLEHLEVTDEGTWRAVAKFQNTALDPNISGPWYDYQPDMLTLYGADTNAIAAFDVTQDHGVLHVRYQYTGSDHLRKSDTYDLVSESYSSPLPYGRQVAQGAWYVRDATVSTGYRMTLPGASLTLAFSAPSATGQVTVTVSGAPNGVGNGSFPMTVNGDDASGEFTHIEHDWSRTPWALTLHRNATDYSVVLQRFDASGVYGQNEFQGTLPIAP